MYAGENNNVIAEYHKAYFKKEWDGFHGFYYLPPEKATGHAMAAVNGRVAHIAFNVFTAYNKTAYTEHKKLVKKCLDAIGFKPTVTTDLPSTSRVTLTETSENIRQAQPLKWTENSSTPLLYRPKKKPTRSLKTTRSA